MLETKWDKGGATWETAGGCQVSQPKWDEERVPLQEGSLAMACWSLLGEEGFCMMEQLGTGCETPSNVKTASAQDGRQSSMECGSLTTTWSREEQPG